MIPTIAERPSLDAETKWLEIASKGYSVQPLAGPSEVESLSKLYASTIATAPTDFFISALHQSISTKRLIRDGVRKILNDKLAELLPGFQMVSASFVTKKARSVNGRLGLHQDCSVVDHDKHLGINVWVPLCNVDSSNACLRVADYSHRFNLIGFLPPRYAFTSDFETQLRPPFIEDLPMKAGEGCIFDTRLMHASEENQSDHDRVAVLLSLIPDGESIRLHFRNPDYPDRLDAYQVDSEFILHFDPLVYPSELVRESMRFVESFEYTPRKLSMEDFAALRPDILQSPQILSGGDDVVNAASRWPRLLTAFRSWILQSVQSFILSFKKGRPLRIDGG